jgi:DNA-binding protein H-NS
MRRQLARRASLAERKATAETASKRDSCGHKKSWPDVGRAPPPPACIQRAINNLFLV